MYKALLIASILFASKIKAQKYSLVFSIADFSNQNTINTSLMDSINYDNKIKSFIPKYSIHCTYKNNSFARATILHSSNQGAINNIQEKQLIKTSFQNEYRITTSGLKIMIGKEYNFNQLLFILAGGISYTFTNHKLDNTKIEYYTRVNSKNTFTLASGSITETKYSETTQIALSINVGCYYPIKSYLQIGLECQPTYSYSLALNTKTSNIRFYDANNKTTNTIQTSAPYKINSKKFTTLNPEFAVRIFIVKKKKKIVMAPAKTKTK